MFPEFELPIPRQPFPLSCDFATFGGAVFDWTRKEWRFGRSPRSSPDTRFGPLIELRRKSSKSCAGLVSVDDLLCFGKEGSLIFINCDGEIHNLQFLGAGCIRQICSLGTSIVVSRCDRSVVVGKSVVPITCGGIDTCAIGEVACSDPGGQVCFYNAERASLCYRMDFSSLAASEVSGIQKFSCRYRFPSAAPSEVLAVVNEQQVFLSDRRIRRDLTQLVHPHENALTSVIPYDNNQFALLSRDRFSLCDLRFRRLDHCVYDNRPGGDNQWLLESGRVAIYTSDPPALLLLLEPGNSQKEASLPVAKRAGLTEVLKHNGSLFHLYSDCSFFRQSLAAESTSDQFKVQYLPRKEAPAKFSQERFVPYKNLQLLRKEIRSTSVNHEQAEPISDEPPLPPPEPSSDAVTCASNWKFEDPSCADKTDPQIAAISCSQQPALERQVKSQSSTVPLSKSQPFASLSSQKKRGF